MKTAFDLEEFRTMKDEFFKRDPHSPLTDEQKSGFNGLIYFEPNPALDLTLKLEPLKTQDKIEVQMSTGDIQEYIRWGKIQFEVGDEPAELTVFLSPGGHGYFLPFADATSGKETYGAGRYLDLEPNADGTIHVDFNIAYNPYCAYDDRWSCPLTPFENRLTVRIEAGEKKFE